MNNLLQDLATALIEEKNLKFLSGLIGDLARCHLNGELELSSSWHPLGFLHFKLGEADDRRYLRLHIWPKNQRIYQEPKFPIHNHIFSFRSVILVGSIRNDVFEVLDTKSGTQHAVYNVRYVNSRSILSKSVDTVSIRLANQRLYTTGSHYDMPSDLFHQSFVHENEFTATLLLTQNQSQESAKVLGDIDGAAIYEYERKTSDYRFTSTQLQTLAKALMTVASHNSTNHDTRFVDKK